MIKYWEVEVSHSWDRTSHSKIYNFETEEEANEFYEKEKSKKEDGKYVDKPQEKQIIFKKELLDVIIKEYKWERNQWVFKTNVGFDGVPETLVKDEIIKFCSKRMERLSCANKTKFELIINGKLEHTTIYEG